MTLDVLRVLGGLALAGHFAAHLKGTATVIGEGGPWHSARSWGDLPIQWSAARHMTPQALRVAFAACSAAGLGLAANVAPGALAALLFFASATTNAALSPFVTVDDQVSTLLCLWLALMAADVRPASRATAGCTIRLSVPAGPSFALFELCAAAVYLSLGFSYVPATRFSLLCFTATAAMLATRGRTWQRVAAIPGAVSLWLLFRTGEASLACATLAAAYVAAVAGWPLRDAARPRTACPPPLRFDSRAGMGAICLATMALNWTAVAVGARPVGGSTAALLSMAGLPSWPLHLAPRTAGARLTLLFAPDGEAAERASWSSSGDDRFEALLQAIEPSAAGDDGGMRARLLRALVERYCRSPSTMAGVAGKVLLRTEAGEVQPVAWFSCGSRGEDARTVPLAPPSNLYPAGTTS